MRLFFNIAFCFPILLFAQAKDLIIQQEDKSPQVSEEKLFCFSPVQLSISHVFGKGVGHKGYSSAELFFIQSRVEQFSPYLDTRLHVMNNGNIASNVGVGFRSIFEKSKISIGGNVYYDYYNSPHLNTHQIGGGVEFLNEYLDFGVNGYLPIGGTKHASPCIFDGFKENRINVKRTTYYAFPSINAEVGTPILWPFPKVINLYAAIGPYYLFGNTISSNYYQSSWGVNLRITAGITRYLELEFELNHDSIYNTTYQGMISFHIPLYKSSTCRPQGNLRKNAYSERTLRRPIRNEIIPVKKKSETHTLKDSHGNNILAYFINNAASCPGLGTFESPFCSFSLAENNIPKGPVLVYVFEGNSLSNNYNTDHYIMQPEQILQGSGTSIALNGVTIPPFTVGQPILTNPAGRGVDLASGTTIRGLTFQNTSGTSIYGDDLSGSITIDQCKIFDSNGQGVEITNHTGHVVITNNLISNIINNGISLDHVTNAAQSWISGNTILNAKQSGVLIRLNHPDAFGWIVNNYFSRNILPDGSGFDIGTEVAQGALIITSNSMQSNTQNNIHALDGLHVITNNTLTALSSTSSPAITYITTASGLSPRKVYISNNYASMTTSNSHGIRVTNNSAPADFYAEINGNVINTASPSSGLRVDVPNPGSACVSIKGNSAESFVLNGTSGPINVQQTQAEYQLLNQASTGFSESGTVNFGSDCTTP